MKAHVACGGTGGHIFPGIATAEELRRRGHDVALWLAGKDVEAPALRGWAGPVLTVPAEGFQGGGPVPAARTVWRLARAARRCVRLMRADRPDALLAMGSYASIGPVRAALRHRVPYVLHEANVIPGRAIELCARRAAVVAAAFEETRYYMRRRHLDVTGMPLRRSLVEAASARGTECGGGFTVLVSGGSRGARTLNRIVAAAAAEAVRRRPGIRILHVAGPADEERVRAEYAQRGVRAEVLGFCGRMEELYLQAHLAVCRAGASTCAELALFGLPALLVPYPHATRNHQAANARALEKTGAADVVLEKDLEPGWLAEYLAGMKDSPSRLARMSRASLRRARGGAAAALADEVERAARGPR